MREILFKAKIKNWREYSKDKQWIEGYYCKRKSGHYTGNRFQEEYKYCIIKEFSDGGMTFSDIDPETVCQYTGLTDKNGRNIFEGDILQLEDRIVKVVWLAGNAQFDCVFIKLNRDFEIVNFKGVCPRDYEHYEVIGNIFDNPELIGDNNG